MRIGDWSSDVCSSDLWQPKRLILLLIPFQRHCFPPYSPSAGKQPTGRAPALNNILYSCVNLFYSISPRPDFTIFFEPRRSISTLSSIPLIKPLLLGVLYSLEISIYSLIDTFTGISGNFSNSHKVIFIRMV